MVQLTKLRYQFDLILSYKLYLRASVVIFNLSSVEISSFFFFFFTTYGKFCKSLDIQKLSLDTINERGETRGKRVDILRTFVKIHP